MRYGTHFMLQLVGREKGCAFSQIIDYLLATVRDRKSTRLNSSHSQISYAVFCLKKKKTSMLLLHRLPPSRELGASSSRAHPPVTSSAGQVRRRHAPTHPRRGPAPGLSPWAPAAY